MKELFSKIFKKSTVEKGPKNKIALRWGSYTAVIALIAVVLLIGVNLLAALISDRLPIDIDVTAEKENSVTQENLDIIKGIKNDVKVTVCASQDGYVGEYMAYFAANMYMAEDSTVGCKYYQQTVNLVKEYAKYNSKIKVEFIDVQDPAFSNIAAAYPNHSFVYGDILVESPAYNADGTPRLNEVGVQITNSTFIQYDDIYSLSDPTGYAAYGYENYTVSSNSIETKLTSAIYSVTSTETVNLGIISGHGDATPLEALTDRLELNNYAVTDISDTIITEISSDIDVIAIAAPKADFTASELSVIEKFLDNGGKKGKGLLFFASVYSPELPNLYAFLREWGVEYDASKVMFETNEENYIKSPAVIGLTLTEAKTVKDLASNAYIYLASDNIYMKPAFTESGKRTTEEMVTTSDTVVAVPAGAADDYSLAGLETTQTSAVIVTTETIEDNDYNSLSSYVVCFASDDFISSSWAEYSSIGNMDAAITVTNAVVGRDEGAVYFSPKTITNESFTDKLSAASVAIINLVVLGIVPVAIIVIGILVVVRRRRR